MSTILRKKHQMSTNFASARSTILIKNHQVSTNFAPARSTSLKKKTQNKSTIFKVKQHQASTKFASEESFKNNLGLEQFFWSTALATILVL